MSATRRDKAGKRDIDAPDPKAIEAIGQALRVHYADLVLTPPPDKFAELLARLEARTRASRPQGRRDAVG